ncbi:MAG: zf-HC2 domain-containing protein [Acidimicrobiales bacterium]
MTAPTPPFAAGPPVDPARIDANWRAITFDLDAPRPSWTERLLRRVGVPSAAARLVVATPGLRRSWFAALVAVVVLGLGAADPERPTESMFTLLVLAPLLPVLGVVLAYGDAEPAHEIVLATPRRGLHTILLRTATVLAIAAPVVGLAALASPAPAWLAVAWLLPGLTCTLAALSLATAVGPRRATAATAIGWLAAAAGMAGAVDGVGRLAVFSPASQLAWLAAAAVFGGIVVARRDAFDHLSPASGTVR